MIAGDCWPILALVSGIVLLAMLIGYSLWPSVDEETEDPEDAAFTRATAAKRDLDAQAFLAALAIQDAIRRNGGARE
jgi:hypothetical protein